MSPRLLYLKKTFFFFSFFDTDGLELCCREWKEWLPSWDRPKRFRKLPRTVVLRCGGSGAGADVVTEFVPAVIGVVFIIEPTFVAEKVLGRVVGDELPNTVDSFAIRVVASRRRLIARDSDEVPEQQP